MGKFLFSFVLLSIDNIEVKGLSSPFSEFNTYKMYSNFGVNSKTSECVPRSNVVIENPVDSFEQKKNVSFSGSKTKRNVFIATGGALAAASIAFLFNRRMSLDKAQKIFQKTFMNNDISLDDTSKIIEEFKEISKIEDITDYINALFKSAKKRYGLDHLNIKLSVEDLGAGKLGAMDAGNTLHVSKNAKRNKIVEIIFHEFRHAKQNDIMATSNLDRYIKGILGRSTTDDVLEKSQMFKTLMKKLDRKGLTEEQLREHVLIYLKDRMLKSARMKFETMGYGAGELPKIENIDAFAEKCFEAYSKYNDGNVFAYFFNFLEKDARGAASGICDVFKNLGKL